MSWSATLHAAPLRQPDQRSCGAAVAVAAAALHRGDSPPAAGRDFDAEVLRTHRLLTAARDARGAAQLPWPASLGTPPWSLAHHLTAASGLRHRVGVVRLAPVCAVASVRAALEAGHPVALYLGSRTLPRHVVLALPPRVSDTTADRWAVYDPAPGRVRHLPVARWTSGTIDECSWPVAWGVVAPDLRTGRAAPRTPA